MTFEYYIINTNIGEITKGSVLDRGDRVTSPDNKTLIKYTLYMYVHANIKQIISEKDLINIFMNSVRLTNAEFRSLHGH